ncbi:MAG: menaquinone biosynthesis protein [Bacteroidetes bacterium]|nr:menaquinone biosynthesis protein [Bacteroidota bacterium]
MNKIKVAAVSYLNTKPLLYGLKQSALMQQIELIEAYPSKIAGLLVNNEIDLALVPVAVIPQLKEYHLISNYCIGAINNVASVSLFSNVPIEQIDTVILDYQSKTSVALTQVLFKHYWNKQVTFINAKEDYINDINNTTAAVVIGDRALQIRNNYAYNYDLAVAWKILTGLPFVFATWVANKPLPQQFIKDFDATMQIGLDNIDAVVQENTVDYYDSKIYFTENISYEFDEPKRKALDQFLLYLKDINLQ